VVQRSIHRGVGCALGALLGVACLAVVITMIISLFRLPYPPTAPVRGD
jgi:hypothetical protein